MGNWRLRQMRDKNETYQCMKNKIIIAETERLLLRRYLKEDLQVVLVYKCGQEKLNNLYYQMKEQRR